MDWQKHPIHQGSLQPQSPSLWLHPKGEHNQHVMGGHCTHIWLQCQAHWLSHTQQQQLVSH